MASWLTWVTDKFFPNRVENRFKNVYEVVKEKDAPILTGCGSSMMAYVRENHPYNPEHFPAQRYVKEQCMLYLREILFLCSKKKMTVQQLREGVENLHYVAHYLSTKDTDAFRMLIADLVFIVLMIRDLINAAERAAECQPTDWVQVIDFIKAEAAGVEPQPQFVLGKLTDFTILKLIGAGGFGAVYKAKMGEAECCVKFIPPVVLPHIGAAIVDKCVASMINHPCLVKYYSCFAGKDGYVTAMEYIRGMDVIRLLKVMGKLSENLVRVIISQVGLALIHLHLKGFIHRDVKPSNMMIAAGCRVKVIDFDTVKICIGKYNARKNWGFMQRAAKEFEGGGNAGTLTFMAPEIFNETGYGRSIDWWALGITTFELITGHVPFRFEKDIQKIKESVTNAKYEWPADVTPSAPLKSFVERCLTVEAADRLCTAHHNEFLRHPFFGAQNWLHVETAPMLMDFEPLVQLLKDRRPEVVPVDRWTPEASPTAELKQQRLFKEISFEDTEKYIPNIVTYASPGFIRAKQAIKASRAVDKDVIHDPPELIYEEDDPEGSCFANFYESS